MLCAGQQRLFKLGVNDRAWLVLDKTRCVAGNSNVHARLDIDGCPSGLHEKRSARREWGSLARSVNNVYMQANEAGMLSSNHFLLLRMRHACVSMRGELADD